MREIQLVHDSLQKIINSPCLKSEFSNMSYDDFFHQYPYVLNKEQGRCRKEYTLFLLSTYLIAVAKTSE